MTEDFAVVAGGETRTVWHEPADGATPDDPAPQCADELALDADWVSRRREIATAWYDECQFCSATGQQSRDWWTCPECGSRYRSQHARNGCVGGHTLEEAADE